MLDRVAISAAPLRIVCAALLMLLITRVDFFANAITSQVRGEVAGSAIHRPHPQPVLRMRTLGLHQHYMMRERR